MSCRITGTGANTVITCSRGMRSGTVRQVAPPITDCACWSPCGQIMVSRQLDAHLNSCRKCRRLAAEKGGQA